MQLLSCGSIGIARFVHVLSADALLSYKKDLVPILGTLLLTSFREPIKYMHIIKRKTLVEFYQQSGHKDAKGPLEAWYYEAKHAQWANTADIKAKYRSASILKDNRIVFNIAGNKYRLIVRINYDSKTVFIRFIGTHQEYDKIDAEVI